MNITDELREYTEEQVKCLGMTKAQYYKIFAIADRIDAEHEAVLADAHKVARPDYVEMPKDVDDELILFGDLMQIRDCDGYWCGPYEVVSMVFTGLEWRIVFDAGTYAPRECRHHKSDTWERIINDAIVLGVEQEEGKVGFDAYSNQCEALVARCKALAKEYE